MTPVTAQNAGSCADCASARVETWKPYGSLAA